MISDEPDEDADTLDDDTLRRQPMLDDETLRGPCWCGFPVRERIRTSASVREWPPPPAASGTGADIDAATLAWFKANHADWQAELRTVLQTWVTEQSQPPPA